MLVKVAEPISYKVDTRTMGPPCLYDTRTNVLCVNGVLYVIYKQSVQMADARKLKAQRNEREASVQRADAKRVEGNALFKRAAAIKSDPLNHLNFGNRSACHAATRDATESVNLDSKARTEAAGRSTASSKGSPIRRRRRPL